MSLQGIEGSLEYRGIDPNENLGKKRRGGIFRYSAILVV